MMTVASRPQVFMCCWIAALVDSSESWLLRILSRIEASSAVGVVTVRMYRRVLSAAWRLRPLRAVSYKIVVVVGIDPQTLATSILSPGLQKSLHNSAKVAFAMTIAAVSTSTAGPLIAAQVVGSRVKDPSYFSECPLVKVASAAHRWMLDRAAVVQSLYAQPK